MNPLDIILRAMPPIPWSEGDNIPWDDPAFGVRMLREHLSQEHDLASRRLSIIDRQIDWIHHRILGGTPSRVLDLTCGPGLYTQRLAGMGHRCAGLDFSAAALDHAVAQAAARGLPCEYRREDVRTAEFGGEFDLVMMLFGQFNVFRRSEARSILERSFAALAPGGSILIEPQQFDSVEAEGKRGTSWYSCGNGGGLFSERPHLCLTENFWDPAGRVATRRFFIIDAETGEVIRHSLTTEAYTVDEITRLLSGAGFTGIRTVPSLTGDAPDDDGQGAFIGISATRPAAG